MTTSGWRPEFEREPGDGAPREAAPMPRKLFDASAASAMAEKLRPAEQGLMIARLKAISTTMSTMGSMLRDVPQHVVQDEAYSHNLEIYNILSVVYEHLRVAQRLHEIKTPAVLGRIVFLERALKISENVLREAPAQRGGREALGLDLPALGGEDLVQKWKQLQSSAVQERWERLIDHVDRLADRAEHDNVKANGQVPDQERLLLRMIIDTFADTDVTDLNSKASLLLLEEVLGIEQPGNLRLSERQTRGG